MDQLAVERHILLRLYEVWFLRGDHENLHKILKEVGWERKPFWNLVDRMSHDGVIRSSAAGGFYLITAPGILRAEEVDLAPEELVRANERARTLIINTLARVHEEEGRQHSISKADMAQETGLDERVMQSNLRMLTELDYAEAVGGAQYKITYRGIDAAEGYKQQIGLVGEFERISEMSPQPRGRALQKFLARVIGEQGWEQIEGVRTSNEEMDIIVFREREYYLIECKWEKNPIEAEVIRELFGKLGNRVDVRGIVASMSGFTGGAVTQVENFVSQRVILLFGEDDIKLMIYGRVTFGDLLNEKYKDLVTRRKVTFN